MNGSHVEPLMEEEREEERSQHEDAYGDYGDKKHLSDYKVGIEAIDLRERYLSYPRVTLTIGICMGMVGFQWMVQQIRDEDDHQGGLCYVNKKCSYHKNAMGEAVPGHNSNEVLSNLVYVVVGFVVSIYACCRMEGEALMGFRRERGLYSAKHRGMYINACVALIVEGGLSGLYHICPTKWNNQFDYVGISMLSLSLFLMLWSKRHPLIISVGTWAIFFGCIVVLSSLAAINCTHNHPAMNVLIWGLCLFFYFLCMPRLFMMLHYGLPFIVPTRSEDVGFSNCWNALKRMSTFYFFLVMWVLGLVWFVYCCYQQEDVMLTSAIMKYSGGFLFSYMLFYIVNEFKEQRSRWHGEYSEVVDADAHGGLPGDNDDDAVRARKKPHKEEIRQWAKVIVVSILTALFMSIGIYFFRQDVYNTTVSTEESEKLYNKPCRLLRYFDNHDIWHLCSGIALGGVIIVSMMLDDFSKDVKRTELGVF